MIFWRAPSLEAAEFGFHIGNPAVLRVASLDVAGGCVFFIVFQNSLVKNNTIRLSNQNEAILRSSWLTSSSFLHLCFTMIEVNVSQVNWYPVCRPGPGVKGGICWIRWECQPQAINKILASNFTGNLQHIACYCSLRWTPQMGPKIRYPSRLATSAHKKYPKPSDQVIFVSDSSGGQKTKNTSDPTNKCHSSCIS